MLMDQSFLSLRNWEKIRKTRFGRVRNFSEGSWYYSLNWIPLRNSTRGVENHVQKIVSSGVIHCGKLHRDPPPEELLRTILSPSEEYVPCRSVVDPYVPGLSYYFI